MQPPAGMWVLVVVLAALLSTAGGTGGQLSTWQHARHLQSSCDSGTFPELKPVSVLQLAVQHAV